MALPLSPQVFAILAPLIEDHAGLHYDFADRDVLAGKLSDRAVERGFDSLLDYYYFLRYDPAGAAELATLVESLVVHETYLFREAQPLKVVVDAIVPALLRKKGEIRVWSAACATGEEPYSLAMMLTDAGLQDRVRIIASDISTKALARARTGVFSGRSLRVLSPPYPRHLVEEKLGSLRATDELRERIVWQKVNLLDAGAVRALGSFDVILCRNALIYFADPTVARVAQHLGDALSVDGVLVLGASESLLRFGTLFICEEQGGSFFYRRRPE